MNTDEYQTKQGQSIADRLIEAIEKDDRIVSTCSLSIQAIRDNLPAVCDTIVKAISENNPALIGMAKLDRGNKHGETRSAQDFEPAEIVREFFLLKQIILAESKYLSLESSPVEILDRVALIDMTINKVMENCFQSYAKCRKQQIDSLHQQIFLTNQEISRLLAEHQDSLHYLVHEIKNPLTSIIGYSDLYLRQQRQDAKESIVTANLEHVQQVLYQGRNVLRLINDTLELSSYQKGNLKLRIRKIDVCLLLEDIAISLKPTLEAKQLKLITSCLPNRLAIESDPLRLQQIITNLLTNAIRYTIKGSISLSCSRLENNLEIKIIDTGVGISVENRARIFEPYFRSDLSQASVPEGVGLGLAIVSQLVSLLGGEVKLDSELDIGSTFTVVIPIVIADNQTD